MSLLIVGLGNIGEKYEGTRHNIGFEVLDYLVAKKNIAFSQDRLSYSAKIQMGGQSVVFIKPTTFMNLSGDAVLYWKRKLDLENNEILVITDDLALPFGSIRIRPKGSSGGHNGLTDIEQKLNSQEFARMRMGIGSDFPKGQQASYVLGKFPPDLQEKKEEWVAKAGEAVLCFCTRGLQIAMNQFNS
jgi:PTH1 family peptidyl-tRNA hydrolase